MVSTAVLIVGAGPTGLLLGAELNRRGVDCQLIDANPAPLHWDRATVVHPRTMEVFESLGIVEPLLAAGVKQRMARIHSAGSVLGEIDLSLCGSRYPFNLGLSEEVTEQILTKYLEELGGQVVRSSKLVNLEERAEGLLASIDHDGQTERVSAQWVIGCDGIRSITRKFAGIELLGSDLAEPWAVFDATIAKWPHSYEAIYAYFDEIPVILTALPKQRWRVYLRPSSAESDLVADAAMTLARYLPAIAFDEVTNPTRFHCHTNVASRYRAGRILLAGDAAHVCSPSQGHGMNSGIQDAFNLAWKLALVCQGHATGALLDSYQAERHPVAETIIATGDDFEKALDLTDPAQRRARDEALRANFADPKFRHHESVAEAELDIDYSHSPTVIGDRHPALSPGQRLPDTIEVSAPSGEARLLHELTHRAGHTALLIAGPQVSIDQLTQLESQIKSVALPPLIEATFSLAVHRDSDGQATTPSGAIRLVPSAAARLGINDVTLLLIRPDAHVALRADKKHLESLKAYQSLLVSS